MAVLEVDQKTKEFVAGKHQLLIDGEWTDAASGQTFPTGDPSTEDVLAQVPRGGAEDIDRAVGPLGARSRTELRGGG